MARWHVHPTSRGRRFLTGLDRQVGRNEGGKTMTTQDGGSVEVERFKPTGTVALTVVFVLVMLILWFSVWAILVTRGATT